jgi:hypothetical protein
LTNPIDGVFGAWNALGRMECATDSLGFEDAVGEIQRKSCQRIFWNGLSGLEPNNPLNPLPKSVDSALFTHRSEFPNRIFEPKAPRI